MAQIDKRSAQVALDPGSAPSVQVSDILGRAVEGLGQSIGQVAAKLQERQTQKDDFAYRLQSQQFTSDLDALQFDALKSTPADGTGLHDQVVGVGDRARGPMGGFKPGSFDKAFDAAKARMPVSKQSDFEQTREVYRHDLSEKLAVKQYGIEVDYNRLAIQRSQDDLLNKLAASDPTTADQSFEDYKAFGLETIATSKLPALEKEVAKDKWNATAAETLYRVRLEKDPAFASQARGALGLTPTPGAPAYMPPNATAGMRNNNPGNIKFAGQAGTTPSQNTDQGDRQAVYATPEAGMRAAYDLARKKYDGGKTTANQLIAGDGGWTPGNTQAAANIAASMGLGPDDDLNLKDPTRATQFLRGLVKQEHGPASKAYTDSMLSDAVNGTSTAGAAPARADLPIVTGDTAGRVQSVPDLKGVHPEVITRFKTLQNAFGQSLPIVSGFRDPARNARAGGAKHSQHMEGNAFDIDVRDMPQSEQVRLIKMARANGFGGIGVYGNTIHIDVGSVRAWGPSHHSASVPDWARDAVNTPVGGSPGVHPDQIDHRFDAIPLERRFVLANAADVQVREVDQMTAAQAKADYASHKDAVDLQIATGRITDPGLIVADTKLDDGDKASFVRAVNTANKENNQIGSDLAALQAGTLKLDAYDPGAKSRVDKMFDKVVPNLPQDQQPAFVKETVRQTGIVPQPVVNGIRTNLASNSPADVIQGARAASTLSDINRNALLVRDGGNDVATSADLFNHYRDIGLTEDQAARRLIDLRDPTKARERAALIESKTTKDWITSTATESTVASIFTTAGSGDWWFELPSVAGLKRDAGINPELGTPATSAAIVAEYKETLEESLVDAGGDPDAAKTLADQRFKARYGTSEMSLSGPDTVTRLPPEKTYPAGADGTHNYIREQATEALKAEGVPAGPLPSEASVATLNLTPQEKNLYQHHLDNIRNGKFTRNDDGSISTVYQTSVDIQGKTYNFPTVWDGKILPTNEAVKRSLQDKPLDQWPSYANPAEAEARYAKMHDVMAPDVQPLETGTDVKPSDIFLQSDQTTDADVRAGRPPHYQLFYKDKDGLLQRYHLPFYAVPPNQADIRQQQLDESQSRMEQNRQQQLDEAARRSEQPAYDASPILPPGSVPDMPTRAPAFTPIPAPPIPGDARSSIEGQRGALSDQRGALSEQRRALVDTSPASIPGIR